MTNTSHKYQKNDPQNKGHTVMYTKTQIPRKQWEVHKTVNLPDICVVYNERNFF